MQNVAQQSLSGRQTEIANLVVTGKSTRAIAETLFLSPRTVEHHIEAIFNKLGIASRVELAAALLTAARNPTLDSTKNSAETNLPARRASLIGREAEIEDLLGLFQISRLVTVTGAGGVGKTTTALAVGEAYVEHAAAGAWFVDLAPLAHGSFVAGAIARSLGVKEAHSGPLLEPLLARLKHTSLLLILDNCEHVIAEAAALAGALLRGCPRLRILATSRASLRIAGEQTYRLPSLRVPTATESVSLTVAEAARYAAVTLFVERAQAVDRAFTLSDDSAPIVADICRRLDGLPLAIELAAARVTMLSPRQLRERLKDHFGVLTNRNRDALPRQQTIRALIDWSHNLLDERERTVFRRLAIFANGCTLEAAVAIAGSNDLSALDVFDALASLVDKSLVLADCVSDPMRYRLLGSSGTYAAEKLTEAGERDAIARGHLRYHRDIFAELHADYERTLRPDRFDATFAKELDDLRAALDGALIRADIVMGAQLLAAIDRMWTGFGLCREARGCIESFTAQLQKTETLLRAQLLAIHASLLCDEGLFALSRSVSANAVMAARESGDSPTLAFALVHCAYASIFLDDITAATIALSEAGALSGSSARLQYNLLEARAQLYKRIGDLDAAMPILVQMREQWRAFGNLRNEAVVATIIAEIEHQRGRTLTAIAVMRQIFPTLQQLRDSRMRTEAATALSGFLLAVNDLAGAIEAAREAIAALADYEQNSSCITIAIEHVALVCALHDDLPRAAILAGYGDAALARAGSKRTFTAETTYDRLAMILRAKLAPSDLARLLAEGAGLTPETAIADALAVTVS